MKNWCHLNAILCADAPAHLGLAITDELHIRSYHAQRTLERSDSFTRSIQAVIDRGGEGCTRIGRRQPDLLIPPFGDVSNYPIAPLSFDNLSFNIFLVSLFSIGTNWLLNLIILHTNEVQVMYKLTSVERRFILQYNRHGALLMRSRSGNPSKERDNYTCSML